MIHQGHWQDLIRPYKLQVDTNSDRLITIIAEPLERGFGATLGNALRRVLLSSLKGAAVTSVHIDGVLHEFSTVSGVLEDVTDIILNVKGLALRMPGDRQRKIYITATGPCEVRAEMINSDSGVEVINKQHLICTLEEGAKFGMEMTVETGRGYVPANRDREEEVTIGSIAVDALFSPVRKVSYKVENTRVGQSVDYDKLLLTVETNGVIKPEDAVGMAAKILQDQLKQFINFEESEISKETKVEQEITFNQNLLRRIEELELSARSMNCLKGENIVYIGDLVQKSENEMLRTPNFGRKSLNEIKEVLSQMSLYLGMPVSGWPPENIEELARKVNDKVG